MADAHHQQAHHHAGVAVAEAGLVLLEGPDGVAVSMTPHAAAETAQSLAAAATEAQRQRDAGEAPA
jgi:hypothetical protein